jgi:hypothetical protein
MASDNKLADLDGEALYRALRGAEIAAGRDIPPPWRRLKPWRRRVYDDAAIRLREML